MNKQQPEATYCGQPANQGLLIPRPIQENEGYATLECGGTKVILTYTLLHQMSGHLAIGCCGDGNAKDYSEMQKAINAIICEASIGNKPIPVR